MPRRLPGRAIQAGTITVTQLETSVANTVQTGGGPKITSVQVTSNSYVVLDDTAVDIAGGYIKITGTGFAAGCQVLINNTPATSTTFIGPTEVRAQLPASSAGTYMLYLINADGGVAIRVNGVTFSATPSWVTASDLTSYALGDAISIQLAATGASTFALAAGSTLPTGLTLSAGGLLSGSVTGLENDTSYSFTITATDAENQDSPRTFSITITVQLQVSRSLRFNSADSAYLSRTPATAGNRQTWTWSAWVKRSSLGVETDIFGLRVDGNNQFRFYFNSSNSIDVYDQVSATINLRLTTTQVFRDSSAWYHITLTCDTTNSTSTDRFRLYINGDRVTAFSTNTQPSQNYQTFINSTNVHYLGYFSSVSGNYYITENFFIDGQALTPAAFAETNNTTGQYIPKKYTGTYGTNGFYLPFTDNSSVLNLGRNYQPLTTDPFWNRTVLLLNGTGTNNANNNTFIDSSTNAFAITRNGNTTQGRFSPFTQGGWSNYFDGTANGSLRTDSSTDTNLSGDFTIQAWVYPTASGQSNNSEIISRGAATTLNGWHFGLIASTTQLFFGINYASSGNTSTNTQSSTNIPLNQWTHVAVTRSGNTCIIYINGVVDTTNTGFTGTPTVSGTEYVYVGRASYDTTTRQFTGYINNASIIKGTALTTFSQTQPLATGTSGQALLTCTANRFIDTNTATTAKILTAGSGASVAAFSPFTPTTAYSAVTHGGSAYFDGTGDWVNPSTTSANLALGSGDFTIEFWLNTSRGATRQYIFDFRNNGSTASITPATAPIIIWGDDGADGNGNWLRYAGISNGTVIANADLLGVTLSTLSNQWNHIAIVRSSGTVYGYLNGLRKNSVADSTNYNVNCSVSIAAAFNGGANYLGNISDFRVVKGTAVYTGTTYTVPTAPVTAVANTSLLLNFTNAAIVDATGDNNIETVGDAKISTAQSKWAGSSMLFDGTDDTLTIADSPVLELGTGDFTIEAWIYPTLITGSNRAIFGHGTDGNNWWGFFLQPTGVLEFGAVSGGSVFVDRISSNSISLNTWTHVAVTRNGSTFKLWIGGSEPPSYTGSPATTSSAITDWSSPFWVGGPRWSGNTTSQFVGYLQDVRVTRAARYTGNFTPPTAQFAYNQGDINYNQWVPTNFSVTAGAGNDSLLDVPTNWGVDTGLGGEVRGNYCTWNPTHSTSASTANGNLEATLSGNAGLSGQIRGSMANLSGKWYWESVVTADGNQSHWIGVIGASSRYDIRLDNSNTLNQVLYARYDGQKIVNGTISAYGASYIVGDVVGIALDLDIGIVTFYKNNVSQGAISLPTTGIAYTPVFWYSTTVTSGTIASNFGQRPFAYAAPSGFKALNTHNLPAVAVAKSNTAFDTVLYTGTGTARTITGFNFGPDLVWVKQRSGASTAHSLQDIVRGADKHLTSNGTDIEVNSAAYGGGVTAFTGNGFSTGTWGAVNENTQTYVAWAWDAGTTTVVNTAGSITANVRVNSTSGFSIVSWIGTGANATVGHGLNAVPRFIIVRNRDTVYNWRVWHTALSGTQLLYLNTTDATVTDATMWNSTIPTSTVFSLGTNGGVNESTKNIIAYCFAAVPGFSAFGSYTGNGSTDGPFVHTGFRPAFVIWKRTDTAGNNWTMQDYKRSNPYNPADGELMPSSSAAESTLFSKVDFLSNGFKLRSTNAGENASNGTYIYAAFAESPFKYARAR